MADDSRPLSSFLFCKEDATPIKFFLRPSVAKARLRPLIEKRGGIVTSQLHGNQDCIKLAVEGDTITSDDYITVQYIDDCIETNRLLPMDNYRANEQQKRPTSPANSTISNVSCKGRIRYSNKDDAAILTYIAKHLDCSYSGNALWKKMELLKITDHSWQSMKYRFSKKLVDHLPKYADLLEKQKQKDSASSPEGDSREKDSSESSGKETTLKTPRSKQSQPAGLDSDENPGTSKSHPADQGKDSNPGTEAHESSSESLSDFDDYLLQLAEKSTPKEIGHSTEDTDEPEECPQTQKRHPGSHQGDTSQDSLEDTTEEGLHPRKRRRKHQSESSEADELVTSVVEDMDTRIEPESFDSSSTSDPGFQTYVDKVTAFVKEVVEDYSVPVLTVMQLLYFHSLNLDAVLDHLETGESDVVWTNENDKKLNSGTHEDLKELCKIYGKDEVVRRHAFFDV